MPPRNPLKTLLFLYILLLFTPLLIFLIALTLPGAKGGVFFVFPFVVFSSDGVGAQQLLIPLAFALIILFIALYTIHYLPRLMEGYLFYQNESSGEPGGGGGREVPRGSSGKMEGGAAGVIFIGPIPIVFSTSRGGLLLILLPVILILIFLAFFALLLFAG